MHPHQLAPRAGRAVRIVSTSVVVAGLAATASGVAQAATSPGSPAPGPGFVVRCGLSHSGTVDPIVMPGMTGMSHLHEFFGNTGTDENSTGQSLLGGRTTCDTAGDLSAYWVPALYQDGERIAPVGARIRYDVAPGVTTEAFPVGFMAVAGRSDQSAAWGCATAGSPAVFGTSVADVPTCGAGSHLVAQVTFPSCWDGTSLDSSNHASHLALATDEPGTAPTCPSGFDVHVPRVRFSVDYPSTVTGGSGVRLASGAASTLHADIFEAWRGTSLQARIDASGRGAGAGAGAARTGGQGNSDCAGRRGSSQAPAQQDAQVPQDAQAPAQQDARAQQDAPAPQDAQAPAQPGAQAQQGQRQGQPPRPAPRPMSRPNAQRPAPVA